MVVNTLQVMYHVLYAPVLHLYEQAMPCRLVFMLEAVKCKKIHLCSIRITENVYSAMQLNAIECN